MNRLLSITLGTVLTWASASAFAATRDAVTINFAAHSAELGDASKQALTTLFQAHESDAPSAKIAVAAWCDKGFPDPSSELMRNDVTLAKDRAEAVVKHLRALSQYRDIEVVNMAKRESMFARFFATDAAKVKEAYDGEKDSLLQPWAHYEAETFRQYGGPGKVVVMIYDEAQTLAH